MILIIYKQKQNNIGKFTPADNMGFAKERVNGFDWAFAQGSTFVLQLNFCTKNPAFGNTRNVGCKCNETRTNIKRTKKIVMTNNVFYFFANPLKIKS